MTNPNWYLGISSFKDSFLLILAYYSAISSNYIQFYSYCSQLVKSFIAFVFNTIHSYNLFSFYRDFGQKKLPAMIVWKKNQIPKSHHLALDQWITDWANNRSSCWKRRENLHKNEVSWLATVYTTTILAPPSWCGLLYTNGFLLCHPKWKVLACCYT